VTAHRDTIPRGFLAIRSDIEPAAETDYLHWLAREHTIERVSTDGFLAARVFRALDVPVRRYLILYDLAEAGALAGPDYLGKLARPTPWSSRIMPTLGQFFRAGGTVEASIGHGRGAVIAAGIVDDGHDLPAAADLERALAFDRIAAARLLVTDAGRTAVPTHEKSLRRGDRSCAGLWLVEALDRDALTPAVAALGATTGAQSYESIFAIDRASL
jgi:hypothetical protein